MKYGVIGYKGKIGRLITKLFNEKGHTPVLYVDKNSIKQTDIPEIIIDFSSKDALPHTIELCIKNSANLVIGTTGLSNEDISSLKDLSKKVAILQSYNFSFGINIIVEILEKFKTLFSDWDCEIFEIHHSEKKDKPSGTAFMLEKAINRKINITSARIGGIPGDHTILFANQGELISISHRAISREVFALGALKASEWLLSKKKGYYTFKDVIKEGLK
ncbi:dihydrodipicolinate reductase [Thermosipho sp. 1063]|uniref:4-hydroxy-tetrahydrodipicolinate reductase n=1 Tax=unclassified Thermosipho (in: thermotogales) TaxID=2676525 RepID=UPI00094921B9|nr:MULTISPECIES: dihydrodipicolinate reductase C-terminal domain-containing protein [unclassified Thermosipho (in: thermotogales)]ANQ53102.1 dihydrodipicolinate reductase [Thermosipho sp. 1070]APT71551.1 dihydrodipicolinate reductase [Thermosipho sp. 1063]OOC45627.1 dihydrodipicolinate reductase [Thermosipho sp. 1074]